PRSRSSPSAESPRPSRGAHALAGGHTHPAGYSSPVARNNEIYLTPPVEKAFLVAVDTGDDAGWTAEESLTELASLATTAGADVGGAELQNRSHVAPQLA